MIHHRNKMSQLRIEYCAACTFTVWCYARLPLQQVMYMLQFCFVFQYGESCPFQSTVEAIALKLRPMPYALYPCPSELATLREEAEGDLSTVCGVCKHAVDLRKERDRKYLTRIKWHTITESEMTTSAGNWTRISCSWASNLKPLNHSWLLHVAVTLCVYMLAMLALLNCTRVAFAADRFIPEGKSLFFLVDVHHDDI